MKPAEPTLEELYQDARADLARGGTDVALKWAFRHAAAVRRRSKAEEAAKIADHDRFRTSIDWNGAAPGLEQLDALNASTRALYACHADIAEARAAEAACEHVWQLAARTPRHQQQPATPAVKPKAA